MNSPKKKQKKNPFSPPKKLNFPEKKINEKKIKKSNVSSGQAGISGGG